MADQPDGKAPLPQQDDERTAAATPNGLQRQRNNPLHGITLEALVSELVAHFGWPELGRQLPIRCFTHEPSVTSSLKFLRKTPWARAKAEELYLFMKREQARAQRASGGRS